MPDDLHINLATYLPRCGTCQHYAAATLADGQPRPCVRPELNRTGRFTPPSPDFGCVLFEEWSPDG